MRVCLQHAVLTRHMHIFDRLPYMYALGCIRVKDAKQLAENNNISFRAYGDGIIYKCGENTQFLGSEKWADPRPSFKKYFFSIT